MQLLEPFKKWVHTITADNGKEFANHENIAARLGTKFYFADPYSSWQRGLNENTNSLIRQYFKKGSSFVKIGENEVQVVMDKLNRRPIYCGYRIDKHYISGKALQNNFSIGLYKFKLGNVLLSHGEAPHYHRRWMLSLLSSVWDQVVRKLYGHQAILMLYN